MAQYLQHLQASGILSTYKFIDLRALNILENMFINADKFKNEEYSYLFMGYTLPPDHRIPTKKRYAEKKQQLEYDVVNNKKTPIDAGKIEKALIKFYYDQRQTVRRKFTKKSLIELEHGITIAKEKDGSFWLYDNGRDFRHQIKSIADVAPWMFMFWRVYLFKISV
jgi:hypothetical protein